MTVGVDATDDSLSRSFEVQSKQGYLSHFKQFDAQLSSSRAVFEASDNDDNLSAMTAQDEKNGSYNVDNDDDYSEDSMIGRSTHTPPTPSLVLRAKKPLPDISSSSAPHNNNQSLSSPCNISHLLIDQSIPTDITDLETAFVEIERLRRAQESLVQTIHTEKAQGAHWQQRYDALQVLSI